MTALNFEVTACNEKLGLEYNLRLNINRPKRCRNSVLQSALIMCIGAFLGFLVCDSMKKMLVENPCEAKCCFRHISTWMGAADGHEQLQTRAVARPGGDADDITDTFDRKEQLVYVGVMTAEKYLDSRALAVQQSWARTIPGTVAFFTSATSDANQLPIVNLVGVDDSVYPPQKKSFMMLKYMYDNHIDDYEWFVRADDDVFIHGHRLGNFLRSLNSSTKLYLGQAGQGIDSEHGLLGLDPMDNYCMGGPTMIFSRATLKEMVPQISSCIKNLVSTHEDVEIGRCVRKFTGAHCPWAFEFRNLFYQNHDEPNGSFTRPGTLRKLVKPITMHPVKECKHLHRMQVHFLANRIADARFNNLLLHRDVTVMNELLDGKIPTPGFPAFPILDQFQPKFAQDVIPWDYFDKVYYSPRQISSMRKLPQSMFLGIDTVVSETMLLINSRARELGRHIDFRGLLYGYARVDPLHAAQYVTDLLLSYHKHRGKHIKVPVRRHSYLHQAFTEADIRLPIKSTPDNADGVIYFIVPVFNRIEAFVRFTKNFEDSCLKDKALVHLILVSFEAEESDNHAKILGIISELKLSYSHARIEVIRGESTFSRARALQQGARACPLDSLLFFVDLDVQFNKSTLSRIRNNAIRGRQVYFPIVFSQYNPALVCSNLTGAHCLHDHFILSESRGYWRHFGFGTVAIYREDFFAVGGFDLTIEGWGKEDVDFYEKCLKSDLTVFRSPDVGFVHIYHPIHCPNRLPEAQHRMCRGTMRSNFAPVTFMADLILENIHVFDVE